MHYSIQQIASFTILIPGVIGLIRFKKINKSYYPLIYLIWLGCIAEITGSVSVKLFRSNALVYNFYVLAEGILITWLFINLKIFGRKGRYISGVVLVFLITWLVEWIAKGTLQERFNYYRIFYSFIIVLMSIRIFNEYLINGLVVGKYEPIILLGVVFIVYFTYKLLIQVFAAYGLIKSIEFQIRLYFIMSVINLLANLLYAVTLTWIPRRMRFTLQY